MSAPARDVQKKKKKNPTVADQRDGSCVFERPVLRLGEPSASVWKAAAGYNNYGLAGRRAAGPLCFSNLGSLCSLDRDQVGLHNTPLCSEEEGEKEGERENCRRARRPK